MLFNHFPEIWQAVVFRNYGKVPAKRIAAVLKTTEKNIHNAAADLGLGSFLFQQEWDGKGYITTIRNNWHLLSVGQLLTLLDMPMRRFEDALRDEDFLSHKLGEKPDVTEPVYAPLTPAAQERTARIRRIVEESITPREARYFDFYGKLTTDKPVCGDGGALRIVHNYCASDPDFLLTGDFSEYPAKYLSELSAGGINGLWFHGFLAKLTDKVPDLETDGHCQKRLENLKSFTQYLAKYGIKAFIYLNEPRRLCTSRADVKEYLYRSVKGIAEAVPRLGGFITITMSENQTNCYSRVRPEEVTCPLCSKRAPDEVAAEVNNIFHKAVCDAGSNARLIAWNWGWSSFSGWNGQQQERAVERLAPSVDVMCVSEEHLEIEKGGVKNRIIDYSVSNPGPSARTERIFSIAQKTGHNTVAKIQAANSWECAAVPYLPALGLLNRHLKGLSECGIRDLMLGWTLGGWPGPNIKLVKAFFDGLTYEEFLFKEYGVNAPVVKAACDRFDGAFTEFPFCLDFVYNGPQNFGCANLFYQDVTGLKSTMIGYPFDDIDKWRENYPREVLLSQLKKLSEGWAEGVKILESLSGGNASLNELKIIAGAAGCHFTSAYLLTEWIMSRDKAALKKEFENTRRLLKLSAQDARIGFEASNHYLYNENNLLEKLVNLAYLDSSLASSN